LCSSFYYSGISSFKDFRREKEMLTLKSKIIDAKLSLGFMQIKLDLTPSNLLISLAKEYVLPEIVHFLRDSGEKVRDDGES